MSDIKDKRSGTEHLDRIARDLDLDMDAPLGSAFAAALRGDGQGEEMSAEELYLQLDAEGLDAEADEFVPAPEPAGLIMTTLDQKPAASPLPHQPQPPQPSFTASSSFARVTDPQSAGGFLTPAAKPAAPPPVAAPEAVAPPIPQPVAAAAPVRHSVQPLATAPSAHGGAAQVPVAPGPVAQGPVAQGPAWAGAELPESPAPRLHPEIVHSLEVFADDGEPEEPEAPFAATAGEDDYPAASGGADDGDLYGSMHAEGGDRMIPRISIHAFCVKTGTLGLMRRIQADRRLRNVAMEVREGGLAGAITHYAAETTPNLLILEGTGDPRQLLAELDQLAEYCDENIRVLILGETNDIRFYRELMSRGVSEYLVKPIDPVQLIRSISALFADPETPFTGKTFAVTGVKGGVGSSCIAHNLAWALSERIKVNATLVDLDLNFGTTGLDFNQDTGATIADALMSPDRFDEAIMGRLVTKATDRLSLFTAPASLDRTYNLDPETYVQVLEQVRGSVPFVVLDLPHIWSDWFKATIIGADEIVIVAAPELASLRNGKNLVDFLKAARPNDSPPRLVLNMLGVPKRPEIPPKDFGQAIGLEPSLVIPFEPQVFGTASNNGQMIFDVAPESKCSLAIDQLAAMLSGKTIQAEKPSIIKKILRR